MQLPMAGTWNVVVREARPFQIHGDLYFELHVVRDEQPEQVLAVRVPQHVVGAAPLSGERMALTFLMGQVTSVGRR